MRYVSKRSFLSNFNQTGMTKDSEITQTKRTRVCYFFMRNQHMKVQDSSMHGSKDIGGIWMCDGRKTDRKAESNMPPHFFQSWGINIIVPLGSWTYPWFFFLIFFLLSGSLMLMYVCGSHYKHYSPRSDCALSLTTALYICVLYCKHYGQRSDCSIWSSLIRVQHGCYHDKNESGCLCIYICSRRYFLDKNSI